MLFDLARALFAAALVGVLPGWFWAKVLRATTDRAEWLAYSIALSMALVPAVALVPARVLGFGVTVPVAVFSAVFVFGAGLAVYLRFGVGEKPLGPLVPHLVVPLGLPALVPVGVAAALALGVALGAVPLTPSMLPIALLLVLAGAVHLLAPRWRIEPQPDLPGEHAEDVWATGTPAGSPTGWWRLLLPVVLALVVARGYLGPVLRDWPFIRGVDHYSHAVMANLMMSEGRIYPYLIYPPGFHTMTAMVSRLSGLRPLEVFPVLAPALLVLPPLALYALARRLWGWQVGVAAALLAGLVLKGSYWYFADSMYPNFVTAQFLLVLTVAALAGLCASPGARSGLLLALFGSSVVVYHQVASMYLALLLALVSLYFLPYLLIRDRKRGLALLVSLALLSALSLLYAWDTYDLPQAVARFLGGSGESDTGTAVGSADTGTAVGSAIGTQPPYSPEELLWWVVSQPVAWFGLLGALIAATGLLRGQTDTPRRLAVLTPLLWTVVLAVGSSTALVGFPQRFGRDLGVPLALLAGLALVCVFRSLGLQRRPVTVYAASLAVLLAGALVGLQAARNFEDAGGPSLRQHLGPGLTINGEISAAGDWLREHNEGGNIMVSPHLNQVPSRMMLAMGEYPAMQSYTSETILKDRDLPPGGADPLWDVLWVMKNPDDDRALQMLEEHDIRYVVIYKNMPDRLTEDYWLLFQAHPDLYRIAFQNRDVVILQPRYSSVKAQRTGRACAASCGRQPW